MSLLLINQSEDDMNAWLYLSIGILFEVMGTSALKLSNGFTVLIPSLFCVVCFTTALYSLSLSIKTIDISIVYAIWSGAGIALISIISIIFFHEKMTVLKLTFLSLIIIGVVGLQIIESGKSSETASQDGILDS